MEKNLQDIAAELGISISTVSRVVNKKSYVNEKTREKVLHALEKYDYTPNLMARSLQARSAKTIGVILPDITENLFGNIYNAITYIAENDGFSVVLSDSKEVPQIERRYLKYMLERRMDGVILATVGGSNEILKKYADKNIPVVFIDNMCSAIDYSELFCSVLLDNERAGRISTETLLNKGCRNVAFICGKVEEYTGYGRLKGYNEALNFRFGSSARPSVEYGDFKEKSGYDAMRKLLESENKPDGVVVSSSKMTYGAIKALRDYGLSYPRDIRLIGFDIYDPYETMVPGITSILQPENEIGTKAAQLLIERIKNPKTGKSVVKVEPFIIHKQSG